MQAPQDQKRRRKKKKKSVSWPVKERKRLLEGAPCWPKCRAPSPRFPRRPPCPTTADSSVREPGLEHRRRTWDGAARQGARETREGAPAATMPLGRATGRGVPGPTVGGWLWAAGHGALGGSAVDAVSERILRVV